MHVAPNHWHDPLVPIRPPDGMLCGFAFVGQNRTQNNPFSFRCFSFWYTMPVDYNLHVLFLLPRTATKNESMSGSKSEPCLMNEGRRQAIPQNRPHELEKGHD
jgi:hypothetical protein